jgi:hypothetical protein
LHRRWEPCAEEFAKDLLLFKDSKFRFTQFYLIEGMFDFGIHESGNAISVVEFRAHLAQT